MQETNREAAFLDFGYNMSPLLPAQLADPVILAP
jgi:hypothetical protein